MFSNSSDLTISEEIIRQQWPSLGTDAAIKDESDWDILNDNNADAASNRHWFKQNYINQMPQSISQVIYH